jgi:polyhydroxybutyrate depolymerase
MNVVNGNNTMRFGERTRTFILHLPTARDRNKQVPLVLVLHGHGGRAAGMVQITGFNGLADRNGFVVVYPDGVDETWNDGHFTDPKVLEVDDVGFISALIDGLSASLNIDPKRVYVSGFSNGAVMSNRLGCDLSDKIAAIGYVAGLLGEGVAVNCPPKQHISVVAFHGTADPTAPFNGGPSAAGIAPSAFQTIGKWAEFEGCAATPTITNEPDVDPNDGTRVMRRTYGGCKNSMSVILYVIENGGHAWPGNTRAPDNSRSGKTSLDIDASQVIWNFFASHPKP